MKIRHLPSLFCQISGLLIVLLANVCQGAEPSLKPIEPFGGLKWTDGIVQITKKINQMEGIVKLYVGNNDQPGASLKGLANDSEIISSLAGLVKPDPFKGSYKDKDGVEYPLAVSFENITAEPILLKGVPFRMLLNFDSSPGFAVTYPQAVFPAVLKIRDRKAPGGFKEIQASCSFALTRVTLSSVTPLQTDKIQELMNTLKDKYKDYAQGGENGGLVFQDASGSTLEVEGEPSAKGDGVTLFIKYKHDSGEWDKLYKSHLSNLEKKASSNKPDKSNDL